jgi:hypothetical protein
MVQGGKHSCQVERVIEAGGQGDPKPQPAGGTRDVGQHHQRIEQVQLPAASQDRVVGAFVDVVDAGQVLEEAGIEAPGFQHAADVFVALGQQHVAQRRLGMPPGSMVMEGRPGFQEGDQVHLTGWHGQGPWNIARSITTRRKAYAIRGLCSGCA